MQALDAPNDESYEVEKIIEHYESSGGVQYLIKWKNYDDSHNEILDYEHFDSDKIIRKYWKQLRKQNPHQATIKPNEAKAPQKQNLKRKTVTWEKTSERTKRSKKK